MGKLNKGYVQIYTGNGKGKTTAAVGLAFRAVGDGMKVFMIQFLKTGKTGELVSAKKFYPDLQIFRFEKKRGFVWTLKDEEIEELKKEIKIAYEFALKVLEENQCDILILDEIMGVLGNKFLTIEDVIRLIESKPENMELIMTGRNVPKEIIDKADLVSEMKDIKHYFNEGVPAREGIEF
ncbi:cob(I)yrinic acid a,c-diamide adenosyltransferase [Clostridium fallax]|uniref:Cob(I)yrinic acid a,c-diamide adenosyltransferase n=1 Tax=Clostridium fallax TaxID=1533 RepID=A0A1M4WMR2_9CLOT|nr:cob(I)yrinic acid a,c-diamide adenosyltransferase [Clostridium fallax]SHE82516.1 cob(I)yrinic acid a,c-diamide adenosyltransferase [Clostridium fallax]SQB06235.1 ATP:corrinoid adenosyltransferase [Clostridium fallax]